MFIATIFVGNMADCGTKPIGSSLSGRTIVTGAIGGMLSVFAGRVLNLTASVITSSREGVGAIVLAVCSGVSKTGSTTVLVPEEGEADCHPLHEQPV